MGPRARTVSEKRKNVSPARFRIPHGPIHSEVTIATTLCTRMMQIQKENCANVAAVYVVQLIEHFVL